MKQLFRQVPCPHCEAYIENGTRGIGCIDCNQTGKVYVPVAEVQGAVSRKAVLKRLIAFRQALKRTAPTEELIGAEITELRRQIREDLPSVLPAESRRSEEEIRIKNVLEWFREHKKTHGRNRALQWHPFVAMSSEDAVILWCEYLQGEENEWSKLFAPSGSNQDKGKEGNK